MESNPPALLRWWWPRWFPSLHITEQEGFFAVEVSFPYRDFVGNATPHTQLTMPWHLFLRGQLLHSTMEGMVWGCGLQLLPPDPAHIKQGRRRRRREVPAKWDIARGDTALPDATNEMAHDKRVVASESWEVPSHHMGRGSSCQRTATVCVSITLTWLHKTAG